MTLSRYAVSSLIEEAAVGTLHGPGLSEDTSLFVPGDVGRSFPVLGSLHQINVDLVKNLLHGLGLVLVGRPLFSDEALEVERHELGVPLLILLLVQS